MDDRTPPQSPVARGSALIAAAIFASALVLSWGISEGEPRYQLATSGAAVVRMDTDSGELLACDTRQHCVQIQTPARAVRFGPLTFRARKSTSSEAPVPPHVPE